MRRPDYDRRVAITGLGVVSPIGNDIPTVWHNLSHGVSGLGELTRFDLPLHAAGTEFEQRVWDALVTIPYGETISYGELAREVGSVARAVGRANGRNPISIIVPCHRVIGADGSLTGYAGGLDQKRALLDSKVRMSLEMPDNPRSPDSRYRSFSMARASILRSSIRYTITPGSRAPQRVPIGSPSAGVNAIVVARLRPASIAHMLAPLPRCRMIVFAVAAFGSRRGSSEAMYS